MILINGSIGIGTGFSTNVPCFHPINIVDNIKRILNKKRPVYQPVFFYDLIFSK